MGVHKCDQHVTKVNLHTCQPAPSWHLQDYLAQVGHVRKLLSSTAAWVLSMSNPLQISPSQQGPSGPGTAISASPEILEKEGWKEGERKSWFGSFALQYHSVNGVQLSMCQSPPASCLSAFQGC